MRKTFTNVLAVVFTPLSGGTKSDTLGSLFVCADVKSGEVLWQNWIHQAGYEPMNPKKGFMDKVHKPFPARGQPMI